MEAYYRMFLLRSLCVLVATILVIIALVKLGKRKKHFQIFPDSIKREYFKEARLMTFLNIESVAFIFISCFLFNSPLFYILILLSIFLTIHSLINIDENFNDSHDN